MGQYLTINHLWSPVFQQVQELEADLSRQQEVNDELSQEMKEVGSSEDLEKVIKDLESQLETLKKSEKLALQKVKELEGELYNLKTLEEVRRQIF